MDNVLRLRNTGIICVTAKCAKNVPSADLLSKSDAYMRLHIKAGCCRSSLGQPRFASALKSSLRHFGVVISRKTLM